MSEIVVTPLTAAERAKLSNHELTIERGQRHVFNVARALRAIREEQLYRENHPTFEAYCEAKWNFTRSRASQLIGYYSFLKDHFEKEVEAAKTAEDLPSWMPANERYVRALKRLPANQQKEAWLQLEPLQADGSLTLAIVEAHVENWLAHSVATNPAEPASEVRQTLFDDAEKQEEKPPYVPPLRQPIERDSAAEVDRIAESTVQTLRRDWRALPIDGRPKWLAYVTNALGELDAELPPACDSEPAIEEVEAVRINAITDEEREQAISMLRVDIQDMALGSPEHKKTWIAMLQRNMLGGEHYRTEIVNGITLMAFSTGVGVASQGRAAVLSWEEIYEALAE